MSRLHTTTVRFDADSWASISREAERLGISRATLIREATQARIVRGECLTELSMLLTRVERLERAVVIAYRANRDGATRGQA